MSVTWKKLWRDLARNKARTVLAVLATAVGIFALGLTFGLSGVMQESMTAAHKAVLPDQITFYGGPFDQEIVDTLLEESNVVAVEGERNAMIHWRLEGEQDWRNGFLYTRSDYGNQTTYLVERIDGEWPAEKNVAAERLASDYFGIPSGSSVIIETAEGEQVLPVAGVVREHMVFPPLWGGNAIFFSTPKTANWITGVEMEFTKLRVRIDDYNEETVHATAQEMQDQIELMGYRVEAYGITDPEVHWQQEMINACFLIMAVLGVMSLGLSGFLIINTMTALLSQQVWQIGVMKSVGATVGKLVRTYLMMALIYGLLAVLIAVPLGALGANWLAVFMLNLLNIEHTSFYLDPGTMTLQVMIGLFVPLLAALVPIANGVRITAHKAMSRHGIGNGFGENWFDRLIARIRRLPRPTALSLRNTFRRKARVSLTLITLVLSGVMFTMILTMDKSFGTTIDAIFDLFGNDVSVYMDQAYDPVELVEIAEDVPEVIAAEVDNYRVATTPLASGQNIQVSLRGIPSGSKMFNPRIVSGSGLPSGDERAILINSVFADENGFEAGDDITLTILGTESTWKVAGITLDVDSSQHEFFVSFDTLAREVSKEYLVYFVEVKVEQPGLESEKRVAEELIDVFEAQGYGTAGYWSLSEGRQQNVNLFGTLTYTLMSMAIIAAVVGSIGLMSTMSINVVERLREIGVMRSVGASSPAIVAVFVTEGLLLGLISWLLAVPLSIPCAKLFNNVIGQTIVGFGLDFDYAVGGVFFWLAIVLVLSALASLWPALKATRVSVRETLAYE
jgi:putative ABC transport system permease protein